MTPVDHGLAPKTAITTLNVRVIQNPDLSLCSPPSAALLHPHDGNWRVYNVDFQMWPSALTSLLSISSGSQIPAWNFRQDIP